MNKKNNYAWVLSSSASKVTSYSWGDKDQWSESKKQSIASFMAESALIDAQHNDPRLLSAYARANQIFELVGSECLQCFISAANRLKRVKAPFKPDPFCVNAALSLIQLHISLSIEDSKTEQILREN